MGGAVGGARQRRTSKRRRHDGSDTDSEGDAEWRYAEDGDKGDDGGGVAAAGVVGDTDWRERSARARREQRGRVADARGRTSDL